MISYSGTNKSTLFKMYTINFGRFTNFYFSPSVIIIDNSTILNLIFNNSKKKKKKKKWFIISTHHLAPNTPNTTILVTREIIY